MTARRSQRCARSSRGNRVYKHRVWAQPPHAGRAGPVLAKPCVCWSATPVESNTAPTKEMMRFEASRPYAMAMGSRPPGHEGDVGRSPRRLPPDALGLNAVVVLEIFPTIEMAVQREPGLVGRQDVGETLCQLRLDHGIEVVIGLFADELLGQHLVPAQQDASDPPPHLFMDDLEVHKQCRLLGFQLLQDALPTEVAASLPALALASEANAVVVSASAMSLPEAECVAANRAT
mmetsp:Transcript_1653/g.4895  ORF Transcript_1653/g.4895 Transcript_1653/m.4895 type:complete len:233 (+) Transcript_1653:2-700(+)